MADPGGAPILEGGIKLLFDIIFAENWMKMKKKWDTGRIPCTPDLSLIYIFLSSNISFRAFLARKYHVTHECTRG